MHRSTREIPKMRARRMHVETWYHRLGHDNGSKGKKRALSKLVKVNTKGTRNLTKTPQKRDAVLSYHTMKSKISVLPKIVRSKGAIQKQQF